MNEPEEALFADTEYVVVRIGRLYGFYVHGRWCRALPVVYVRRT